MESDNWIVQNLQNALNTLNDKLAEIWQLLTTPLSEFKEGAIWQVIVDIHGALMAIGLALLVIFFLMGVIKTCGNFAEVKKPEHAVKLFVRFALAKAVVTYGLSLMVAIFEIVQGTISTIMKSASMGGAVKATLSKEIIEAIEDVGFFSSIPLWAVTLIGSLIITVLSFLVILTVYSRFFKLYLYTGISPLPLATFAGEPTANIGTTFIRSYAGVCLEGALIVLSCIIFNAFASSPPDIAEGAVATTIVWNYVGELIFNVLILVSTIKMSDRLVKEMLGL
jgi:hypothetical protein